MEEPVEFLVGFWKDQEDAFTYKEIRQAILDGAISEETMRLWMQDYSILVAENMGKSAGGWSVRATDHGCLCG